MSAKRISIGINELIRCGIRISSVMGPTGAGKSTVRSSPIPKARFFNLLLPSQFIKTATGADVHVGDNLTSDTQVVRAIKCRDPFQGRDFLLLDTPGFDDTYKSDGEILAEIARWLSKTLSSSLISSFTCLRGTNRYRDGVKLSGILYLHRITDNRMANSLIRNLRMFQELCGGDAFSNVIFVTTHWDACKRGGDSREQELRNNYWKLFLQGGSQMLRFENAKSSAWNIINALPSTQKPLKIQRELVDEQKLLSETSAGGPLFSWFGRLSQSLKRYIGRLTNLSKTASRNSENKQYERRLRAGIARAEADLREVENQRSRLSGRTSDLN